MIFKYYDNRYSNAAFNDIDTKRKWTVIGQIYFLQ